MNLRAEEIYLCAMNKNGRNETTMCFNPAEWLIHQD